MSRINSSFSFFGQRQARRVGLCALAAGLMCAAAIVPAQAIIVRDDVGLANSVDTNNTYPAVTQLFDWDVGGLYGGGAGAIYYNCTGTLINPRTILTAAHCVTNEGATSSEDWGAPGLAPLTKMISYGVDSSDRLFNFLGSPTLLDYNQGGVSFSTDVIIHPSAEQTLGNQAFPWADTALVALSQPVADISAMGILLSPLQSLTHVVQIGYGTFGTGNLGEMGIGTRRLMGENMLGLLGSDSDFIDGVFPAYAPSALTLGFETQVEYYTDFDNPNRPSANAGCDFTGDDIVCATADDIKNVDYFGGDALPREASTAPGDSGGPLIADQLGGPALVIGDLSGGWTFFDGYAPNYGANGTSFYQPLFSVWQFLVENDPYKYVGAKAGDGAWEDPSHWVQLQDPNKFIIDASGNVVVGTPTGSECGVYQGGPKIGSVLGADISGNSTAASPYFFGPEGGTCATASGSGGGSATSITGTQLSNAISKGSITASAKSADKHNDVIHKVVVAANGKVLSSEVKPVSDIIGSQFSGVSGPTAQATGPTYPAGATDPANYGNNLPQSSVLLGPGSTGFVPDNTDGSPGIAFVNPAQYFDVTLAQDGTTSLSSYREIDRLTLGGNAKLDVRDSGVLLSNIDIEVYDNSELHVDGVIGTSDIIADGGVVSGNGIFVLGASPVQTSTAAIVIGDGAITAGNAGSVGTMTVLGNVGVSTGGMMLVDADATATDLVDVYGVMAMNGTVVFNSVGGVTPFYHQGGTFALADHIATTGMSVPDSVTGVLYPVVTLTPGSVSGAGYDAMSIKLEAAPFSSVFTPSNADQTTLATFFTDSRSGHYNQLRGLYGPLDVMEGDALANTFDQLVPNQQRQLEGANSIAQGALFTAIQQRMSELHYASAQGVNASTGFASHRPDQLNLAMDLNSQSGWNFINTPFLQAFAGEKPAIARAATPGYNVGSAAADPIQAQGGGSFLGGWGGFYSASILQGNTRIAGNKNHMDGYVMAAGLDRVVADNFALGAAATLSQATVKLQGTPNSTRTNTYQGVVYGTWSDPVSHVFVDGFASYGAMDADTQRAAKIGGSVVFARANPSGTQGSAGFTIGTAVAADANLTLFPSAGLQYTRFHTKAYAEKGGVIAMNVGADTVKSLLGRFGVQAQGNYILGDDTAFHPHASVMFVNDFEGRGGTVLTSFLSAPTAVLAFNKISRDKSWFELGAGLDFNLAPETVLTLGYNATVSRSDANYGSVTGRLSVKF